MNEFVKLSSVVSCPHCGKFVQLWGELSFTGNWHCPNCATVFPYADLRLPVAAQFIRLTKFEDSLKSATGPALRGAASPTGPLGGPLGPLGTVLTTDYLPISPNYAYPIRQQRPRLMSKALDRTRATRVRGDDYFIFDLAFKGRDFEEYEDLLSFHATMDFNGLFIFTDHIIDTMSSTLRSDFACHFDSDIEAEPPSFNDIDFSVTLEEANVSPKPPSPPPFDLSGTVLTGPHITLTWDMNGEPYDGFKVMRDSGSGFAQIADITDPDTTTYDDTGVTAGHAYSYKVYAYNDNFNSRDSNTITKNT